MKYLAKLSLFLVVFLVACQDDTASPDDASFDLSDFADDFMPNSDTWVINDEEPTMDDFEDLQDVLVDATEAGRLIDLVFPYLESLPDYVFFEKDDDGNNEIQSIRSISCPLVESIGDQVFKGCTTLTTLYFPVAEEMEDQVFHGCTALVDISDAFPLLEEMGEYSFALCTSLTKISFPKLTELERKMFWGCTSLVDISGAFPLVEEVGEYAFWNCTSLENIDNAFPVATELGPYLFYRCTSLVEATDAFPMVEEVGTCAFIACTSLERVSLPAVITLEKKAFYDCGSLSSLELATDGEAFLETMGEDIFSTDAGGSFEGNVFLTIGSDNSINITDNTLTVGGQSYTFAGVAYTTL